MVIRWSGVFVPKSMTNGSITKDGNGGKLTYTLSLKNASSKCE